MTFLMDITLGHYFPGKSILHRLDPRSKLLASLFLMTGVLLTHELKLLMIEISMLFLGMVFSKIPLKIILKNLKGFYWLFLLTFLIHVSDFSGSASFPFVNVHFTQTGLVAGVIYTWRLVLIIIITAYLTLTTSPLELTDSLEKIFSPLKRLKLPVQEFAMMMTMSLRFIPILLTEADRIKHAQLSRGASLEGSLVKKIKNIVPMLLPLFISVIRRADELSVAMEARCYSGGEGRSHYQQLTFHSDDLVVMMLSGAFLLGVLLLR
ncbi:MAG: energy-coupling factor transporter transmembrane component T family protein [bacterium]